MTGAAGQAALAAAVSALAAAIALTGLVAWCGPVDAVKARSSHIRPTPTSGGLAVVAAVTLAAAFALRGGAAADVRPLATLLALAAALGAVGAADDLLDLPASLKLVAIVAAAVLTSCGVAHVTALPLGPRLEAAIGSPLGALGGALFLIVLVNAMNFMDGSNGLAPGVAVISLITLGGWALFRGELEVGAAAFAGAGGAAGLLPWNLRDRVFQGDVGALFSALLIGGVGLLLATWELATPYLVVFTVLPLIVDVLLTLISRARRRERLFEAHRDHLYQLWLRAADRSHSQLAMRVWLLTALTAGAGVLLELYAPEWAFIGLMAATGLLSAGWVLLRARLRAVLPRTAAADAPTADRPAGAAATDMPPNR